MNPVIRQMMAPLQRRVALMVNRAVIVMVNDSLKIQGVQVNLMDGVTRDGVERFQNYGYTSNPHPGAEAIVVSIGGNQDHGIAIAVDDRRYRFTGLREGEVALYDDLGQKVYLTRDGIVIDGAGLPMNIVNVPHTKMSGSLSVEGDINSGANVIAQGDVFDHGTKSTSNMRVVYNGHTQLDPQGGIVGSPREQM